MDRDIRFTQKRVDESWKEQAAKEKGESREREGGPRPQPEAGPKRSKEEIKTSKILMNFFTSLGFQAMLHLGEIPDPETRQRNVNLDAAREIIDLLVEFKTKTQGNRSYEEDQFFTTVLSEIQLKFANATKAYET